MRPLWHLGAYSGTPDEILYAYGHGESVVTFMVQEYGAEKMAELMRAITRTLDIDSALMQVYGLDQHGIDSAWRQEIGLDPLPRPDEHSQARRPLLENIPDATVAPPGLMPSSSSQGVTSRAEPEPAAPAPAARAEPQPAPTQAPADSTIRPTAAPPAAMVEPTAPRPAPAVPAAEAPSGGAPEPTPGGCAPPSAQAGFMGELALLMLLGTPLGLVFIRRGRGKRS